MKTDKIDRSRIDQEYPWWPSIYKSLKPRKTPWIIVGLLLLFFLLPLLLIYLIIIIKFWFLAQPKRRLDALIVKAIERIAPHYGYKVKYPQGVFRHTPFSDLTEAQDWTMRLWLSKEHEGQALNIFDVTGHSDSPGRGSTTDTPKIYETFRGILGTLDLPKGSEGDLLVRHRKTLVGSIGDAAGRPNPFPMPSAAFDEIFLASGNNASALLDDKLCALLVEASDYGMTLGLHLKNDTLSFAIENGGLSPSTIVKTSRLHPLPYNFPAVFKEKLGLLEAILAHVADGVTNKKQ